jgi:Predicted GTPase
MFDKDTIFAKATASGRSGVVVIRISGDHALNAFRAFGRANPCPARQAVLHKFVHQEDFIDSGLIIYFPAPNSFTGEDVVEFQLHGGTAIVKQVTEVLSNLPHFRLAKAGEFAQRAFLNQKMDLVEVEGLVDIINAETKSQHEQAARLMQGACLEFLCQSSSTQCIEPMALLEAYIDFPQMRKSSRISA